MVGEYGELIESGSKSKNDWRKLIYRTCLATKSKDAMGLLLAAKRDYKELTSIGHPEMEEWILWYHMGLESGDPEALSVADDLATTCSQMRKHSDYEEVGQKMMLRRSKMGGMVGDRQMCLPGMILIAIRGIDKGMVLEDVRVNAEKWKEQTGRSKPEMIELPWYAFDMHTQAGKIAKGIFIKHSAEKYHITAEEFHSIWFYLESAKTPKHLLRIKKVTDNHNLTCLDSGWWLPIIQNSIRTEKYSPKTVINMWKTGIRDDIKGAVFWILKKREENERQ
jgi:hypothetical protein